MRTINRTIVCALIVSSDKRILLGYRDAESGGVYPDCWHIPGGGVEPGESHGEALIREVLEETGIDISGHPQTFIDDEGEGEGRKRLPSGEEVNTRMQFIVFKCSLPHSHESVSLRPGQEFSKLSWWQPSELKTLKLPPAGTILFKKLNLI